MQKHRWRRHAAVSTAAVMTTASLAAVLVGCSAQSGDSTWTTQPAASSLTRLPGTLPAGKASPPTKVLTFVFENHSLGQMQDGMPYLDNLAHQYAYATDFTAITHPSLPNYLAIAGGSTFGVTDDALPEANASRVGNAESVFDQAIARGHTAKTYAESMPENCAVTSSDPYATKHNPWAYFLAHQGDCATYDVPSGTPDSGALAADIADGSLPNVGLVIPNLCNDAHDCSLSSADTWLSGWLSKVLTSPDFTSGRLVVVVTADEDDHHSDNKILTVVVHAGSPPGQVVTTPLTLYSLSRLYSELIGASPLGEAAASPDMKAAFRL